MSKTYLRCCKKTVDGLHIICPECGTDLIKLINGSAKPKELMNKVVFGTGEYKPANGEGYHLEAGKDYVFSLDDTNMTFKVV